MLSGQVEATNDSTVVAETDSWLADYLNLRVPLAELYEEWSAKDEVFRRFAKRFTGVRMLRQDPWECLCS
jgi:N-glycosylase/DNA lyase